MKTKIIKTKVQRVVSFLISLSAVILFSAGSGFAGETVTFEGVIQGANCVHFKTACPINNQDAHIANERDFVLLLPGSKHYYLPNLDRIVKSRYLGKSVRVTGNLGDHEIWATRLELKGGNGYRTVWTLEEQEKMYQPSGG